MKRGVILAPIALGAALLIVAFTLRYKASEVRRQCRPEPWGASTEGKAIVDDGVSLVAAMYRYRRQVGFWPQTLSDLMPAYASQDQVSRWEYDYKSWGEWSVRSRRAYPRGEAGYRYTDGRGQWAVSGLDADPPERTDQGPDTRPASGPDELLVHKAAELRRRIGGDPRVTTHWRALICLYTRAGQFDEARKACNELAASRPGYWYSPPMLAHIDAQEGKLEEGERRLSGLAASQPSLANHYLLYRYCRATSQPAKALAAIGAAAALQKLDDVSVVDDDGQVTGGESSLGLLFDMARFAYEARDYQLVLTVADAWDRAVAARGYGESSSGFRAPALLAMGDYENAALRCRQAMWENKKHRIWPDDLDALLQAIERKDRDYIYRGWTDLGTPLDLQVKYE